MLLWIASDYDVGCTGQISSNGFVVVFLACKPLLCLCAAMLLRFYLPLYQSIGLTVCHVKFPISKMLNCFRCVGSFSATHVLPRIF
jgi:hypothetical protein